MTTLSPHHPSILVVEDTPANLSLVASLLNTSYRMRLANSGTKALELAATETPDLILLDLMMTPVDGFEICRCLKEDPRTMHVPVLLLTARVNVEDEQRGFALGAVDFIHKPISPPILTVRVKAQLEAKAWRDRMRNQNAWLERQITQRLTEINHLQEAAIQVMVSLAEFRDEITGNHIRRTSKYVHLLATELARTPAHASTLTPDVIDMMAKSAPLHDIGKIAIPDHILLKQGRLTPAERVVIETHAPRGWDLLRRAGAEMGERGQFLATAMEIARSHHEKWDGSGYPDGLAGTAIPLAARLMAVADVFDALLTRRPYKKPMSVERAAAVITEGRGQHFDPDVVDAFTRQLPRFAEIALALADS